MNGRPTSLIPAVPLVAGLLLGIVGLAVVIGLFDDEDATPSAGVQPLLESQTLGDRVGDDDEAGDGATDLPLATPAATRESTSATESDSMDRRQQDESFFWIWAEPDEIRLLWQDDDGRIHSQLESARRSLEADGSLSVAAVTNGGIYEPGLIPIGLYVEDGHELVALNRRTGGGNFYLQPNGVFWIAQGQAAVSPTEEFAEGYQPVPGLNGEPGPRAETVDGARIDLAVQSGPMLVIDGAANERFTATAPSTNIRNAVAVDEQGRILIIMAYRPVNLRALADRCIELGAVDALYLDGAVSRLEFPVAGRPLFPNVPVASIMAVVEPS